MPSPLPQELIDKVIGGIQDDIEGLRACSYASSSFLSSSQQRIFAHVTILPPFSDSKGPSPCQKFHDLLVSSPHLAPYVKSLDIVEGRSKMKLFPSLFPSESRRPETEWLFKGRNPLALILPLLNLQHISITVSAPTRFETQSRPRQSLFRIEELSMEMKISLLDVFRSSTLTSLNLGRIALTPFDFYFVLDNCSGLKELSASDFTVQTFPEQKEIPALEVAPTELDSLTVQGNMDSLFLEHLLAPRSPLKVTRLRELTLVGVDNDEYLEDLIERTRRTLHHLSLQYCEDLRLKQFENLCSIWIASPDPTDWKHAFEKCTHRLEKITLESTLEDLKTLSSLDWTTLDTVLTGPELLNVREVSFMARPTFQRFGPTFQEVEHRDSFSQIAADARKHLSATDAKTILSFDLKLEFPLS